MLERYYIEKEKQEKLLSRKNVKSDFYNGIYDRYEYPVLTREHIPLTWRYDLNPKTNPYFMERLGINAVMNSGAIELNGKYYLVARIEGNDRKSFFGVAESDNGVDGFRFWDYPILLDDTCPEETNVYDMRLTKHEDGYIYGVFCSESKDTSVNDLSAAVAAAGIVRTNFIPRAAQTEANAIPVFPLVGSITVVSLLISPALIAVFIIFVPILSFTECVGFKNSHLPNTVAPLSLLACCNCTSGVFPINSVIFFAYPILSSFSYNFNF